MSNSDPQTYQGVLFDLDGTLIDTADDFILCLNDLRQEIQLTPLPASEIRKVVSDGTRAMITLGFNISEDHPEFENQKQQFFSLYLNTITRKRRLFEYLNDT